MVLPAIAASALQLGVRVGDQITVQTETFGGRTNTIDATIIAQKPKMAPHIAGMCANVAEDLGVEIGQVNIKAKTNEKLGYLGREEGIAAEAVALIAPLAVAAGQAAG